MTAAGQGAQPPWAIPSVAGGKCHRPLPRATSSPAPSAQAASLAGCGRAAHPGQARGRAHGCAGCVSRRLPPRPFLDPSDLCCPGAPASVPSLDLRTVTHKVRSVYTLAASALSRTRTSPPGWVTADCPAVAQCGRGHGTGRLQAAPLTCPLCHPQSNEPLPGRPQRRQDPFSLQVTHSP